MWLWGQRVNRSWSWLRGAHVAAFSAVVGFLLLTPLVADLEAEFGLGILFQLRGASPPPSNVVVIAVDQAFASALGVSLPLPRSNHVKLVNILKEHGAKAIIFDLSFKVDKGAEDKQLADAVRDARQSPVALLQDLRREIVPEGGNDVGVAPVLYDAAAAVAPFPVPTDSRLLMRFWTFRDGTPTLPAVAMQLATADLANDWRKVLADADVDWPIEQARDQPLTKSMNDLHRQFQGTAGLEVKW